MDVVSCDPFTGRELLRMPAARPADIDAALTRAGESAGPWAATPVVERARCLQRFATAVEADAPRLAELIVSEVGKRRVDADAEVAWTAMSARWYADHPPRDENVAGARVTHRPLGVLAAVTPWNVPLITPAWKWLPALMAGSVVVWKPSERATAVALAAHELLLEAAVPDGVVSLVAGDGATARALCGDERVAGVLFTGSEAAGRAIAELVAPRFARCALEMSGINPALVLADADLDLAADCIVASATALAGQKCTATRRVLVAEPVHDALVSALARRIEALRVGDPRDPATDVGPLISPAARAGAEAAVAGALAAGATALARADAPDGDALFAPVLLGDLAADDPLRDHELFAAVLSIESFAHIEAGWAAADATSYGLSAAVYGRDAALLDATVRRLDAGVVAVNRRSDAVDLEAPFAGHRRSGNGAPEGGHYAYASVSELQAVYR